MNQKSLIFILVVAGVLFTACEKKEEKAHIHWSYEGETGPDHWGELTPEFRTCATGNKQSPINLSNMKSKEHTPIEFHYAPGGVEIVNNGHTIQVNYKKGNSIDVEGHTYELKQFHFHEPSENTLEGKSYPMEAHFVHADKEGHLAVVAVFFEEGQMNQELQKAWDFMPTHTNEKNKIGESVDAYILIPQNHDYFTFDGSLTTPPCSEGVLWLVMKGHDMASREQLEKFSVTMHHPNNRPVQPLNGRDIFQ